MTSTTVTLYSYYRSSCSWRIRILLNYKGIEYNYIPVRLSSKGGEQHKDSFKKLNPSQQVPVLDIDGVQLTESVAIAEYLEETRPETPAYPKDAVARARVRTVVEAIAAGIQPKQNLKVLDGVETALLNAGVSSERADAARRPWGAYWNQRGLEAVELLLAEWAGEFSVGDAFSFADCCLVPQVHSAKRFGVDVSRFPTVMRVFEILEQMDCVQKADQNVQPDTPKPTS